LSQAQAVPQRQFSPHAQAVTFACSWHPHAQVAPAQFWQSQEVFFASFMMFLRLGWSTSAIYGHPGGRN